MKTRTLALWVFCAASLLWIIGCPDPEPDPETTDADGDGFDADEDCDDSDDTVYPGAPDVCDGIDDNDCDGATDPMEDDSDGDGVSECEDDCDDADAQTYPGAEDVCDGVDDNDCDGAVDPLEEDDDGDGASDCDGDCDDGDAALNIDDGDGDGYSTCDDDCDDAEPLTYPGAPDDCSLDDNDCDGNADAGDTDDDGDGLSECAGDCDDSDAAMNLDDLDGDGYTPCDGDCDDNDDRYFPEETATSGWIRDCAAWFEADTAEAAWFSHRIEQSRFVDDGNMLAMYFRSGHEAASMQIGQYYTVDDVNWIHGGPVFDGSGVYGDWDYWAVEFPHVIYDPNDLAAPYKMYYSAQDTIANPATRSIGMAMSTNGATWTRYADVNPPFTAIEVVPAGGSGETDEMDAGSPYVYLDGTTYVMLYFCSDAAYQWRSCMATSVDGGYTFTKHDPDPGVGLDPQPILERGGVGEMDEMAVVYPMLVRNGNTEMLWYSGADGAFELSFAVAHIPFGVAEASKLYDVGPTFGRSSQPGRWDDTLTYVTDSYEDNGEFVLFYSGFYDDLSFDGDQVAQIGRAVNTVPAITLTEPAQDPHAMTTGDAVTFAGTASDSEALDELVVVISSEADPALQLVGVCDAAGDWSVTAPGGTFIAGEYDVVITLYDAGGLADSTTLVLQVS